MTALDPHAEKGTRPFLSGLCLQMFALSFIGLFLELMMIRWVPSVVHLVAYYANLMLLSSFLGLGAGALAADRRWTLFRWFPALLALALVVQWLCRGVVLAGSPAEARFEGIDASLVASTLWLVAIFGSNALVFFPLGQRMGALFQALPPLRAYAWDLGGSLAGTLCFGWFSLAHFSPTLGLLIVMAIYLAALVLAGQPFLGAVLGGAAILAFMVKTGDVATIWSPYHAITVCLFDTPTVAETTPPDHLQTMRDPPLYAVKVNQLGYHVDGTLDPARYTPGSRALDLAMGRRNQYILPFAFNNPRDRVLVVGAGGGMDVEAALSSGARHVDAVEIDPGVVEVSHRFSAADPYSDPRVTVHVNDARAFIARARPGYDLIEFGYLDSQALFSSMANVRLDGYVYTVENLRAAFGLIAPRGLLTLSFYVVNPWLGQKIYRMLTLATGREPALYVSGSTWTFVAAKDPGFPLPLVRGPFQRTGFSQPPTIEPATDDWPYLYLSRRTVPLDYVVVIAALLAVSLATLLALRPGALGRLDLHFACLGMGFLLLETKAIGDCSLYFGATWLVSLVVVTGVLLMVVAANAVARRLRAFSLGTYLPLLAALVVLIVVPREWVLGWSLPGRLAWALLAVPLPVFFAGIVFSCTFRDSPHPAGAFGANLLGAMVGGFAEYLTMAFGSQRLFLLVIAIYLGSLLALVGYRRVGGAGAAA